MNNKILIIDDEPALLGALVDKFTREGFTIVVAENGQEGLITALRERPDLILLDIIMPVMDGVTMLNELRKDRWGKKVKVILLTNLADHDKATKELVKKVSGYLVKSDWKLVDVVKKVNKVLALP